MERPANEFGEDRNHFLARISLLSPEEGGRRTPFRQGFRNDFYYKESSNGGYMIWPRFLDEEGNEYPHDSEVPRVVDAWMYIIDDDFRKAIHQKRIKPGVEFVLCEGSRKVADGMVLEITGLFDP